MNHNAFFRVSIRHLFPILLDRYDNAGVAAGHYFHQDLWAAKRIFDRAPSRHIDIGSRVDGFVAHLLVFMPATIIDIRQLDSNIEGLASSRMTLLNSPNCRTTVSNPFLAFMPRSTSG